MRYKFATIWRRPGEKSTNHYDDGWIDAERPVGHTSWVKGPWERTLGYLVYDLEDSRYSREYPSNPMVPVLMTKHEVFKLLGV